MKLMKKILFILPLLAITLIYSIDVYTKTKSNLIGEIQVQENFRNENIIIRDILNINDNIIHNNDYRVEVYEGMTLEELAAKLDRVLNDTLSGKGYLYASHSIELGLDPYLAVAITLLETGCKWNCSYLTDACNNVGGQKGGPLCPGTSYKAFNSLDEGITSFMDNLYYNYVAKGLTTPEQINKKYAESSTWAYKVNNYINEIRAA